MKVHLFLALVCSACMMNYASAVVVVNTETDKAADGTLGAAYSPTFTAGGPSSVDLIEGASPSDEVNAGQPFTEELSTGVSALTNGSVDTFYGDGTAVSDHSAYFVGDGGDSLTYYLGGSFDLTSIVIFGGWNDAGRDQQLYEVFASSDGGANYSSLASVDVNDGVQGTDLNPISTRNELVDDVSPTLAAGITHVRVDFGESENGYTGYTEIDIFGDQVNVPGDADGNGIVNIQDFYMISDNFLTEPATAGTDGDVDFDGDVDQADFRLWRNVTAPGLSGSTVVPEPTSIMLVGTAVLLGLGVKRRRS